MQTQRQVIFKTIYSCYSIIMANCKVRPWGIRDQDHSRTTWNRNQLDHKTKPTRGPNWVLSRELHFFDFYRFLPIFSGNIFQFLLPETPADLNKVRCAYSRRWHLQKQCRIISLGRVSTHRFFWKWVLPTQNKVAFYTSGVILTMKALHGPELAFIFTKLGKTRWPPSLWVKTHLKSSSKPLPSWVNVIQCRALYF